MTHDQACRRFNVSYVYGRGEYVVVSDVLTPRCVHRVEDMQAAQRYISYLMSEKLATWAEVYRPNSKKPIRVTVDEYQRQGLSLPEEDAGISGRTGLDSTHGPTSEQSRAEA